MSDKNFSERLREPMIAGGNTVNEKWKSLRSHFDLHSDHDFYYEKSLESLKELKTQLESEMIEILRLIVVVVVVQVVNWFQFNWILTIDWVKWKRERETIQLTLFYVLVLHAFFARIMMKKINFEEAKKESQSGTCICAFLLFAFCPFFPLFVGTLKKWKRQKERNIIKF